MAQRRVTAVILLIIVLLGLSSAVVRPVVAGRKVRVGIWEAPPYLFHNDEGEVIGLFADILHRAADEAGWELIFCSCDPTACVGMLRSGAIDLLVGDAAASGSLRHSDEFLFDDWAQLYAAEALRLDSILDLEGRIIAVKRGDEATATFLTTLELSGVEVTRLDVFTDDALLGAIDSGIADIGLSSRLYGARNLARYPQVQATDIRCCPHRFYFMADVARNADLLASLDAYLRLAKEDEHSAYYASRLQWLEIPPNGAMSPDAWYLLFIALAVIAIVALLFLLLLRAQVRQRTAALEKEIARHRETERALRQSRLALQRRAKGLTLLSELADALHSSLDFREVTERAVLLIVNQTDFSAGAILALRQESRNFTLVSYVGFSPVVIRIGREVPLAEQLEDGSLDQETIITPDLSQTDLIPPQLRNALLEDGLRACIIVPLVYRKDVLGVLSLFAKEPHHLTQEERSTLLAVGHTIALAMANARYVERIEAEVAVRRQAEAALVEERALLARRVVERTSDLRAANLELAQAIKAKDEFLANMSHEFRTPLNAILGISGALEEEAYGPLTTEQRQALQSIIDSANHLLSLINDILDLSKMGAGKFSLDIGPVEVKALCESSLQMVRQIAQAKNVSLHFDYDARVRLIQADGRRMRQVLVNLLDNAVKFTTPGGSVGLEVRGEPEAQIVHFTIWDTGIGIERTTMQRLFHPFEQGEKGLMREYGGTGLGLALVHRMVELHGGSIEVESRIGKGSRFTVTLAWQEELGPTGMEYNLETTPPLQLPFRRLLYLTGRGHENKTTANLRNAVEGWGMALIVHSLLDDAAALDKRLNPPPDLLFIDLETSPVEEMWRFLNEVLLPKLDGHLPPLVVISAADEAMTTFPLPTDGWLVKPVSGSQVLQTFLRILLSRTVFQEAGAYERPPQGIKVLVVESGETLLTMLQDYFHFRGYLVYSASEGEAALHLAREILPDVIIINLQLQGMSSLEIVRRIRSHPPLRAIPVIALTSLSIQGDRERALEAGVTAYLLRPVGFRHLEEMMMHLLQKNNEELGDG